MDERADYIMEHDKETLRLEVKTDIKVVEQQARWAGIGSGMRVADLGCGPGKTSRALFDMVQSGGEVVGVDIVPHRIDYAQENYQVPGIRFVQRDAREAFGDLGAFDFIWVRFLLEYYGGQAFQMVQHFYKFLKPGGIICLIDLDHNCLSHYGISDRLIQAMFGAAESLKHNFDFDPYVGRKLYSFLYDINCEEIDVHVAAHHLIFGDLSEVDKLNWTSKAKVGVKYSGWDFSQAFPGGYKEFYEEFKRSFYDPRRFTYTPVITARGRKPISKA